MEQGSYSQWLKHIFLWDGILPAFVASVIPIAKFAFPKMGDIELGIGVAFLIVAFFVRLFLGSNYFETHPHHAWQGTVFFLAILYLIFFESLILVLQMEKVPFQVNEAIGFFVLYCPYLLTMGLAFFPFRHVTATNQLQ